MTECFEYASRLGTFRIARDRGMWTASCDHVGLGEYNTSQDALDSLCAGCTSWPGSGDPREAGLPPDLAKWSRQHP